MKYIELYQLKDKCIEEQKKNSRLVLKGNSPILLTTTIFKFHSDSEIPREAVRQNSISNSYLDAIILWLNEHYDLNGIIDYLPVKNTKSERLEQLFDRKYKDKELGKYISENNIQVWYSLRMDYVTAINSFEFMNSNVSTELSYRLRQKKDSKLLVTFCIITQHFG